jgi:beta-lactam-binding protein with PASTA domain
VFVFEVAAKMSSSAAEGKACGAPKTEWPELVGLTIKEAKEKIKADRPDLKVDVVTVGTAVTEEFNMKRVRLWVDTVAKVPRIG